MEVEQAGDAFTIQQQSVYPLVVLCIPYRKGFKIERCRRVLDASRRHITEDVELVWPRTKQCAEDRVIESINCASDVVTGRLPQPRFEYIHCCALQASKHCGSITVVFKAWGYTDAASSRLAAAQQEASNIRTAHLAAHAGREDCVSDTKKKQKMERKKVASQGLEPTT